MGRIISVLGQHSSFSTITFSSYKIKGRTWRRWWISMFAFTEMWLLRFAGDPSFPGPHHKSLLSENGDVLEPCLGVWMNSSTAHNAACRLSFCSMVVAVLSVVHLVLKINSTLIGGMLDTSCNMVARRIEKNCWGNDSLVWHQSLRRLILLEAHQLVLCYRVNTVRP